MCLKRDIQVQTSRPTTRQVNLTNRLRKSNGRDGQRQVLPTFDYFNAIADSDKPGTPYPRYENQLIVDFVEMALHFGAQICKPRVPIGQARLFVKLQTSTIRVGAAVMWKTLRITY